MSSSNPVAADHSWSLYKDSPAPDSFELDTSKGIDQAIATSITHPCIFGFNPTAPSNGRSVLIFGGGGYVELQVGREGVQVARWLSSLGFHAFVLLHRFPNKESGAQAPVDDARVALRMIEEKGFAKSGMGLCGLSSGGHLAACLLSKYPDSWNKSEAVMKMPTLDFAIIGYAPISTNAKGRQVIPNKPALAPPEKQELYDIMQPDVQLQGSVPPTFVVYAANDPVIPVVNAYRLVEGITKTGAAVELHVFSDAPHGFALDTPGLPVSEWPGMCERWLRQSGLLG